ncbi:MAG: PLP-dependent aminotransferase family protein [Spirochaetaceae bacterium]|jgi:2-aminoadipate transaminase|nr:PLP-dependent aminotransferase family protein [Spirochaetaceae bacterium]
MAYQYPFSAGLAPLTGTATRDIFKLLTRPEIISFAGGLPAGDCLPVEAVREITAEIFASPAESAACLQYGATEGYPGLRELIIPLVEDLGITGVGVDNVLMVSGGGQGLDLLCKAFCNPGDAVLVEDPTFLGFLPTAQSYSARTIGVRPGPEGLDLEDLEGKLKAYRPKLVYCIPNFSNPTGKTYSAANREAVAGLAEKYDAVLIEDDPYGRLRFAGESIPPMKTFDRADRTAYVSSFSKTVSPGLRLGFVIAHKDLIRKLAIGKQGADLHSSNLTQLIIKKYLEKGYFFPNVEKSLPIYRKRRNAMIDALDRYMPEEFIHTNPEGGLFIWGEFAAPINTAGVFQNAIARNVAYIPGNVFFAANPPVNTIRLNYSNEDPERIEAGVRTLGEVFKAEIARSR